MIFADTNGADVWVAAFAFAGILVTTIGSIALMFKRSNTKNQERLDHLDAQSSARMAHLTDLNSTQHSDNLRVLESMDKRMDRLGGAVAQMHGDVAAISQWKIDHQHEHDMKDRRT